jgi:hypothetical protein
MQPESSPPSSAPAQKVLGRGLGGFLLEGCGACALVAAVLLGAAEGNALEADYEPQPPHRELAQAEEGG